MKFSLIMGTYGRAERVHGLLESLKNQSYRNFELIVVDQNLDDHIEKGCADYNSYFKIKYLKTETPGLSRSRNIGLKHAIGDIITFPDDDCKYYIETLQAAYDFFSSNNDVHIVLGRIVDEKGNNVIRNWPREELKINKYNFYIRFSSITMFIKRDLDLNPFDESLGVGTSFGSCEDAEYIFTLLRKGKKVIYTPNIRVYHPAFDIRQMNEKKVYSYGLGFGCFCRKCLSIPILYIFTLSLVFHTLRLLNACIRLDGQIVKKSYYSIISRIRGFLRCKTLYGQRNHTNT